jgi:hypothetical protein
VVYADGTPNMEQGELDQILERAPVKNLSESGENEEEPK